MTPCLAASSSQISLCWPLGPPVGASRVPGARKGYPCSSTLGAPRSLAGLNPASTWSDPVSLCFPLGMWVLPIAAAHAFRETRTLC